MLNIYQTNSIASPRMLQHRMRRTDSLVRIASRQSSARSASVIFSNLNGGVEFLLERGDDLFLPTL